MKVYVRMLLALIALVVAALALPALASAEPYPTRPVRVIVPYAPGGPADILARLVAQTLSESVGKQFYVENIGGAGGNIGMGQAAKAEPDGHTLLVVPPNLVVNPLLYATTPYDPFKDFAPVTMAVTSTIVLTVHPTVEAKTAKELVALIKSSPAKYSFASPGTGTPPHLVGEQFRLSLGLDLAHVPFNSAGQAVIATIGGHTPIAFSSLPPAVPQISDGKLRALAVTSRTRSPVLPDVPTMAEAGFPHIAGEGWFAFLVPAGTPKDITALLNREIVKTMAVTDIKARIAALGFEVVGNTPEECTSQLRAESTRWAKVIQDAGIKTQ